VSKTFYADRISTPLAPACVLVDEAGALVAFYFLPEGRSAEAVVEREARGGRIVWDAGRCAAVVAQIAEYFAGDRREFDLPLAPQGSDFQQRVWETLRSIPYGETCTYRELAESIGRPGAFRAVGRANATNPISVIVPCHRVIGSDGSLTGYGGGLPVKEALLSLERQK
jgi:methylated-DNA-[protein]-cysteine S-methyltransferase